MFDNSANSTGSATGSFKGLRMDLTLDAKSSGNGVVLQNGAYVYNHDVKVIGNIDWSSASAAPFYVFSFLGPGSLSFTATHNSPAVFTATGAHPYAGQECTISGGSLPGGFSAGTYYVVNPSGDTFELASTIGGGAVNSTGTGSGTVQFLPYSQFNSGELRVGVECNSTAFTTQPGTINFGVAASQTAGIFNCRGLMDFSQNNPFATNTTEYQGNFQFDGPVYGDGRLFRTTGLGRTNFEAGTISNNAVLYTRFTSLLKAATASTATVTGLALSVGTGGGEKQSQDFTLINLGPGALQFAASGSNVKGGANTIVPPNTAAMFVWEMDSDTWVQVGPQPTVLNPSGDTTGVTDSANIASLLATTGTVLFQPGTFYIDAPITPDSFQLVQGYGYGTLIETGSSFTGSYMIQLAHPATTAEVTIRGLRLYPSANSITGVGGVQLDNTGFSPSGLIPNDTGHLLENVFVVLAGADSFHFDNSVRNLLVKRCDSYNAAGYGFYIGNSGGAGSGCTDSQFTDCTAGHSASHGFYILDANNMFTSCKAWGSGYSGALTGGTISGTTQCGFEVVSTEKNTFVGCQAQQNALHGFDLQSAFQVTVSGCDSDANGAGTGVSTGVGINIDTSTQCTIVGNCGIGTLAGQPGNQIYGIQASGGCSGTWIAANSVTGTSTTFHTGAGGNLYSVLDNTNITDFTHLNNFRIGSPQLYAGTSTVPVSNGTTITVGRGQGSYVLTSTGNVTGLILSIGGLSAGQTVVLINTTSNTMTFAAAGTSFVAGGTGVSVPVLAALLLVYDANTSLWYPA